MNRSLVVMTLCFMACDHRPAFSQAEIDQAKLGEGLPAGFLLGVASSAFQTEGGLDNDWTEWEQSSFPDGTPHIGNGDRAGRAADAWNLWPADIAALEKLGVNAYRLGIEWSRLEPTEGQWDQSAADHYRQVFTALRSRGIAPTVTIYHFALPRWFSAKGGWEWDGALPAFEAYTERVARSFGDLVDSWVTVNEPNGVAIEGYMTGRWPPGVMDNRRAARVLATLLKAHALSARALRAQDTTDADGDGRATWVGIAHHVQILQPASSAPLDGFIAGSTDDFVNEVTLRAAKTGRIHIVIPGDIELDETFEPLVGSFDYLGINFYERNFIRADLGSQTLSTFYVPNDRPTNAVGWDIYPEGFYRVLTRFAAWGWPVLVLENGISDADDSQRPAFLRAHLYALQRAVADGADVRGYFHWSLTDNFELHEGFESRFGLFSIDFDDPALTRVARPSVEVFREAARGLGLAPAP